MQRQAINWTNVALLLIGPSGNKFQLSWNQNTTTFIDANAYRNGKWWPFINGPSVLIWPMSNVIASCMVNGRADEIRGLCGIYATLVIGIRRFEKIEQLFIRHDIYYCDAMLFYHTIIHIMTSKRFLHYYSIVGWVTLTKGHWLGALMHPLLPQNSCCTASTVKPLI